MRRLERQPPDLLRGRADLLTRISLLLALALVPGSAGSATVATPQQEWLSGQVTDQALGEPVAGALVSLLDEGGELHRSVLTGPEGRYVFELPGPGSWSIRVARLGYGETDSEPVEVGAGESATLDLVITSAPLLLDAVEVAAEATGVCRRLDPDEGSLLARLWQEARQALRVVAWAEEEGEYEFELSRWNRTTDLVSDRVVEEEHGDRTTSLRPFETAPIEELLSEGWVQATEDAETFDYFGLDAHLLLSDGFERAHCFEIRQDRSNPDRVGLAFAPTTERDVAGVRGVLWMDRETAALELLDFHYTRHPHVPPIPPELLPLFNGVVEYRELPDGGWIVDRWSLRLPQYQILVGSGHRTVGGLERGFTGEFREAIEAQPRWWRDIAREARLGSVEEGGVLVGIRTSDGTFIPPREQAALVGVVTDSTRTTRLADAEVYLVGTDHRARTDGRGEFQLETPLDGRYRVAFDHPRLDTLGIQALPEVEVELTRGSSTSVSLGVPTERTLMALWCGREPGAEPDGLLWGRVMEPGFDTPLSGVTVELRPRGDAAGLVMETVTDADGVYRFCAVPPEVAFEAAPSLFGIAGDARPIRIAEGAVVSLELPLHLGAVGAVQGVVREGNAGTPVGNATVLAIGDGEQHSATSDSEGRFTFDEMPAGEYELVVSHPAFRELESALTVEGGGRTTHVSISLLRDAIALDPVEIEVDRRPTWGVLAGVYDRREQMEQLGIGTFFDRNDIEQSGTNRIASLVARIPGARVRASRPGAMEIRVHRTNDCHPAFYLDGMPYRLDGIDTPSDLGGEEQDAEEDEFVETIDDVISLHLIEMIEVFRGGSELPIEYGGERALACGVIAVWTRRGH